MKTMIAFPVAVVAAVLVVLGVVAPGSQQQLVAAWPDEPCRFPPGAANFTLEKYSGLWYE